MKNHHTAKFPITVPPPPQLSTETEYWCWPLWKNGKMATILQKIILQQKFQITDLPKFGSPLFQVSMETEYWCYPLWKNGRHFTENHHTAKSPITDPPKNLGLHFSQCRQKWNIGVCHYEKMEKWLPFRRKASDSKIPNNGPSKVLGLHFLSVDRNGILVSAILQRRSLFLFDGWAPLLFPLAVRWFLSYSVKTWYRAISVSVKLSRPMTAVK